MAAELATVADGVHAHGDHVGSTAWLCNHTGALLAMSEIEGRRLRGRQHRQSLWHAGQLLDPPMGRKRRPMDRRLREGDVAAGFEVLAQPGHSPGLLAFWREADRTLVVGDGPVNVSTDPSHPRWLPLPKGVHNDPEQAVASRWRMTELRPDRIVSTHGDPVTGVERWADGTRAAAR